jgi:cyclopropane fatty-acyl-phospholipid synthase-like methyltransferase
MEHVEAPLEYVEKYYEADLAEREAKESKFYLSWLKYVKGKSILSIGCGPNLYDDCQFFSEIPDELIGVDINRANIDFLKKSDNRNLESARDFLKKNKVKSQALVDDVTKPNKKYVGRFDSIYALGVFCAFNPDKLKEIFALLSSYLKPGGVLIDVDWTECQLSEEAKQKKREYLFYNGDQEIEGMGLLMQEAKFSIIKHQVYDVPDKASYGWGKIYGYLAKK